MIDNFELYEELAGLVNTRQGGHVRPHRNFLQWLYQISLELYEMKFQDWERSQKIVDDLSRPFLTSVNVQIKGGVAAFPKDYGHFSSARYYVSDGKAVPLKRLKTLDYCGKELETTNDPVMLDPALRELVESEAEATAILEAVEDPGMEVEITLIPNSKWAGCLNNRIAKPTMQKPKMTQFEGGFRVAPLTVDTIVLDYLRLPKQPTMDYTVVAGNPLTGDGDYIQYNAANSTQLEWSPLVRNEFLTRLEKKFGKFIREDFIWQTSESDRKLIK